MTNAPKLQDPDLWEIWIEYDQFNPQHFGTIYVMGEIAISKFEEPFIVKRNNCSNSSHLTLNIPERRTLVQGRIMEVVYSEPIENLNQYTTVCIYSGNKLVTKIDDIEVLI